LTKIKFKEKIRRKETKTTLRIVVEAGRKTTVGEEEKNNSPTGLG